MKVSCKAMEDQLDSPSQASCQVDLKLALRAKPAFSHCVVLSGNKDVSASRLSALTATSKQKK